MGPYHIQAKSLCFLRYFLQEASLANTRLPFQKDRRTQPLLCLKEKRPKQGQFAFSPNKGDGLRVHEGRSQGHGCMLSTNALVQGLKSGRRRNAEFPTKKRIHTLVLLNCLCRVPHRQVKMHEHGMSGFIQGIYTHPITRVLDGHLILTLLLE